MLRNAECAVGIDYGPFFLATQRKKQPLVTLPSSKNKQDRKRQVAIERKSHVKITRETQEVIYVYFLKRFKAFVLLSPLLHFFLFHQLPLRSPPISFFTENLNG